MRPSVHLASALPAIRWTWLGGLPLVVGALAACSRGPAASATTEAPPAAVARTAQPTVDVHREPTAVTVASTAPAPAAAEAASTAAAPPRAVAEDWAAQRASVAQDRRLATVSPQARPPEFDAAAYRADPRSYLGSTAPSRLWQQADPHSDAPVLSALGTPPLGHAVASGGSTELVLVVPAGWPATFVSMDRGLFQNGLNVITVQSDAAGRATAVFTADPGTTDLVHVSAASPVAAGQVDFQIRISTP